MKKGFLTSVEGIYKVNIFLSLLLILIGSQGLLYSISDSFVSIIERIPLSSYYFLFFLTIGILVPLYVKLTNLKNDIYSSVLDPYLVLILSQILFEILFVNFIGKGVGVLIGLIFSTLRVVQLFILQSSIKKFKMLKRLTLILIILWIVNIIQIFTNRLLPLIN